MISRKDVHEILSSYDLHNLTIGTLGSHSALDIARGATDEGFRSVVVAKKGREKIYTKYFRKRQRNGYSVGCVDEVIVVDSWKEMYENECLNKLKELNTIIIPHRSLEVYLKHEMIQNKLRIPLFGNIELLQAEERTGPEKLEKNQDYLLKIAGIPTPQKFDSYKSIDRPVMVKATAALGERDFERNFPIVKSPQDFEAKLNEVVSRGKTAEERKILEDNFRSAVIEEFMDGPKVNMNYFYSVVHNELELSGTDTRLQFPNGEEAAHLPLSLRESLYESVYDYGEKFVEITKKEFPPGIIGPFSLQCVGNKEEKWLVYDASLRIGGSPDVGITPTANYFYGSFDGRMDFGRRIAREIKEAIKLKMLKKLVS